VIAPGARVADRFDLLRLEMGAPLYRAYTALELGAAREVTLWIPHAGLLNTPEARARFVDAARATRAADGAHLVRVIDAGVDPFLGAQEAAAVAGVGAARGGVWVSVAPAAGQTLAERIARGRPAQDQVVAYLAQSLARAIDSAHAARLVHGYLRAGDVIMAGEWPRLSGVGLWTHVDRQAALSALRADVHLLAPEVRAGEAPTGRADVYAMAVILAEVALGQAAESGAEAAVLRDRLRRERPNLEVALRAAFSATPGERPVSASMLAAELASLAPPTPRTGRSTAEVRVGGQVITPVVGTPTSAFMSPQEVPTLLSQRAPSASSIAAAILSASEQDDAEHAFDETGEFQTRPRELLTPPPVPAALGAEVSRRNTGQTPVPRLLQTPPNTFARKSGEVSALGESHVIPRKTGEMPALGGEARVIVRKSAEMPAALGSDARMVARGTMPPPDQEGDGKDAPLVLANVRPESAMPATYESLSIESDPPTAQTAIRLPSQDEEAAIATAEFDADVATAARVIAHAALAADPSPRTTIDAEATPPGGMAQAVLPAGQPLPLPAPEITEIRPAPTMPPSHLGASDNDDNYDNDDATHDLGEEGPLIVASSSSTLRRYPTAQIFVADAFTERALDANRQKLKLLAIAVALVAGAAGLVYWWQHASQGGSVTPHVAVAPAPPPRPVAPPRPAPAPVAAPPTGPCLAGMILVEAKDQRFCIDVDEASGAEHMPRTGVTLSDAMTACGAQHKRLCAGREWETACRGPNRASYPWGYKPSTSNIFCNLGPGRVISPVGSFDKCISASGAHDMSGNVAEWVAEGQLRGGSALVNGDGRCSRPLKVTPDRPLDDVGFRCCADPAL